MPLPDRLEADRWLLVFSTADSGTCSPFLITQKETLWPICSCSAPWTLGSVPWRMEPGGQVRRQKSVKSVDGWMCRYWFRRTECGVCTVVSGTHWWKKHKFWKKIDGDRLTGCVNVVQRHGQRCTQLCFSTTERDALVLVSAQRRDEQRRFSSARTWRSMVGCNDGFRWIDR